MTTIKNYLLLVLTFIVVNDLDAQESHFGIKGGWNNTVVNDIPKEWNDLEFDRLNGFHIGIFNEWYMGDHLGFGVEALFSGKGSIIQVVDTAQITTESTVRLNYLTIPVLLQYKIGPLFLQAGPELGFKLNTIVEKDGIGILDEDFWDQSFDLSGVAGIGLDIGNLFVSARYGLSFNKLIEVTETDINGNIEREGTYGQNSFWQLSVGVRLF